MSYRVPIWRTQLVREGSVEGSARPIKSAEQVAELFRQYLPGPDREYTVAVLINTAGAACGIHTVSVGSINEGMMPVPQVFRAAILAAATAVIVAHNHPSGSTKPSPEDDAVTKRLVESGRLLGLPVLDHVIVTEEGYYSYKQEGRIGDERRVR